MNLRNLTWEWRSKQIFGNAVLFINKKRFFLMCKLITTQKSHFWQCFFFLFSHLSCLTCTFAFWYLTSEKHSKYTLFFFFCNVLFLHIKSYTLVLAFCYLSSWKTLLIYVSVSIVSFPHIGSFEFILSFWYLTRWKTHITHVFGNVVLFLHKRCVERVLAFWYISSKNFKRHVFFFFYNIVLFSHMEFFYAF